MEPCKTAPSKSLFLVESGPYGGTGIRQTSWGRYSFAGRAEKVDCAEGDKPGIDRGPIHNKEVFDEPDMIRAATGIIDSGENEC